MRASLKCFRRREPLPRSDEECAGDEIVGPS